MTSSKVSHWLPALLLGLYSLLFFWQYFLLDQTLYAGDTAFVLLPFHHFATSYLKQGLLPLWNPHLFGGTPGLAEAQYQVFYPPNLLFFFTGVARGTGWMLPLHLAFMGAGTYLFARRSLLLCRSAAMLVALAFAFCGCIQSRLAVSVFTEAAAWLPWMLLWYDRARLRGGVSLALPGVALAMQVLTGAPQYAFYSLVLLLAYHLFHPFAGSSEHRQGAPRGGAWLALGATLVFGVLLSAAQLIPQWELARLSDRSTRATFEYATQFSLAPVHFVTTMLFPKFYGLFTTASADNFYPGEETSYLGIVSLCLIGAAIMAAHSRRSVGFWVCALSVSLSFAFGKYNPLYSVLYEWVPGFAMFRAPARWLLVTSFCGAVLAGFGLQALLSDATRKVALRTALTVACLLFIAGVATLVSPYAASALAIPQSPYSAWGQVVLCGITAILLGVLVFQARPGFIRRAPAVILLLLAIDLFALSQDMEMQSTLSVEAVETRPATVTQLQSTGFQERFWPDDAQIPMERWQINDTTTSPLQFRAGNAAAMRAIMPSCVPAEFQTSGLTGA